MNEKEGMIDLTEYLPEYLRGCHEIKEIIKTENKEIQKIAECHQRCIEDRFVMTCGEYGMQRFEKMLGISPLADDTLEMRRFRVMSKQGMANVYNYLFLSQQLGILCGEGGYSLCLDFAGQTLKVKVALTSKNMLDSVRKMLSAILPCNLSVDVGLMYNQYLLIENLTYGQMENYMYEQLKEDVISV